MHRAVRQSVSEDRNGKQLTTQGGGRRGYLYNAGQNYANKLEIIATKKALMDKYMDGVYVAQETERN